MYTHRDIYVCIIDVDNWKCKLKLKGKIKIKVYIKLPIILKDNIFTQNNKIKR